MSEQGSPHMSPAQAAQVAGVSRWSILRAIKSFKLKAKRDNRNGWRIAPDDLAEWCAAQGAHRVHDSADTQDTAQLDAVAELRERLAEAERRAAVSDARAEAAERARDLAEAQAEAWRAIADKLAAPRRWWPFK